MKISFIIGSVGRVKELENCIFSIREACRHSNDIAAEVIVVFQGKDREAMVALQRPNQYQCAFYTINRSGLSAARNYGISKSTGEYFVFIDDDASLKEDFLIEFRKIFLSTTARNFCGAIIDPINNKPFAAVFNKMGRKYLGMLDFRYFMGSAHIVSRESFRRVGCYDEEFGAGARFMGAEESDLFFRLKQHNERILYDPALVFFHYAANTIENNRVFNYSYAVGAILTKQCIHDPSRFLIYFFILVSITTRALIRACQNVFFPATIAAKNLKFRYSAVFKGMVMGVIDYVRARGFSRDK